MSPQRDQLSRVDQLTLEIHDVLCEVDRHWRDELGHDGGGLPAVRNRFVDAWRPVLKARLDPLYAAMAEALPELRPAQLTQSEALYRALVQPWFLQSAFVRRAFDKPLGYPGDYGLVEMIFGGREAAATPMGRLLGDYALHVGPSAAHRGRLPWAQSWLDRVAASLGRPPTVLSFACGPEVILRDWVERGNVADIVLADQDPAALAHARGRLEKARRGNPAVRVRAVPTHALQILPGTDVLTRLGLEAPVDVVMVLGLLDYLTDADTVDFLTGLAQALRPGGVMLLSNLSGPNPWRPLMEFTADWKVIHRSVAEFEGLVHQTRVLGDPRTELHGSGTNLYCAARRAGGAASGI